jgi:hypothetical protein
MPDAVDTVTRAPDDGRGYLPKHVELFTDINKLRSEEHTSELQSPSRKVAVTVLLMPDAVDTVT